MHFLLNPVLKLETQTTECNLPRFSGKLELQKMQSDNIHSRLSFPPPINAFNSKPWQNDKFQSISNATRKFQMNLSNIHFNVSEQELLQVFGGPSAVISCKIDYDNMEGRWALRRYCLLAKRLHKGQALYGKLLNM